jgi:tetratricopeptide (TPR) repeat protein
VEQRKPDARTMQTLDDLADFLRRLRSASGNMPFRRIRSAIHSRYQRESIPAAPPSLATVHGYFQNGRVRMNPDTVLDIARALGLDAEERRSLEQACRRVLDRANRSLIVSTHAVIPAPTPAFTGRRAERARIAELVEAARAENRAAVIVIEGMAGIGKTELAHQAALDLAEAGLVGRTHLFADLRGYDPQEPPAAADAVVRGFLGHLGVPGRRIDILSPAARVALLHQELAPGALIVLDNAADASQVRPLLPPGSGSVALVTSRRRLTALDAATRMPLDVIALEEAVDLLRRYDPAGRLEAAPQDAIALVEMCRRLPLELAAVGRQLANKPEWGIGDHVERLKRIPPVEHSGPALAMSYGGLPESTRRLFRLLAVHPGRRFTGQDVGALASDCVANMDAELTRLYDESLLLQRDEGAFEFHDSVRAYATELAHREDPASLQQAAIGNLLRYHRERLVSTDDSQSAWLSAERADLLACLHVPGHDEAVVALATALNRRLRLLGHYDEARICNLQLLRIARRASNLAWEADARSGLAEIDRLTGKFRAAGTGFGKALQLRTRLGDLAGQADSLRGLAQVSSNDDYPAAVERYEAALKIHRRLGNPAGEAEALWGLAEIALSLGDHATAEAHGTAVAGICRRIGNRIGEAYGLRALGDVAVERGDLAAATQRYRASLDLCRGIGNRRGAAFAVRGLAGAALRAGDLHRSEQLYREALDVCLAIGDIAGEADANRGLAETAMAGGEVAAAVHRYQLALVIYRETSDRVGEAHTLAGLGHAARRTRRHALARVYWQQALRVADRSGLPLSGELRKALGPSPTAGSRDSSFAT